MSTLRSGCSRQHRMNDFDMILVCSERVRFTRLFGIRRARASIRLHSCTSERVANSSSWRVNESATTMRGTEASTTPDQLRNRFAIDVSGEGDQAAAYNPETQRLVSFSTLNIRIELFSGLG
jgi:hypothetical protein